MEKIICAGQIMVDAVFSGFSEKLEKGKELITNNYMLDVGGGAAITGLALTELGFEVEILTSIGYDALGDYLRNKLKENNIGVNLIKRLSSVKTNLSVELSDTDDRITITGIGSKEYINFTKLKSDFFKNTKHLHISWKEIGEDEIRLAEYANIRGMSVSLDTDFVKAENQASILEIIPFVHLLLPNIKEIKGWNGIFDELEAAKDLASRAQKEKICVVKRGDKGALAVSREKVYQKDAFKVSPVDTVGAGDAFNAGFIFGFLKNKPIDYCLELGNALGALSTQKIGGFNSVPKKREISKLIELT